MKNSIRRRVVNATFWGNIALLIAYLAQVLFISRFGVGTSLDAYLAANAITNFFMAGIGGGFLNSLISGLLRDGGDKSDIKGTACAVSLTIGIVFIAIGAIVYVFAEAILYTIIPALMAKQAGFAVSLLRVNALALIFNGTAFGFSSALFAQGRMGFASFSPALISLGGIMGVILAGNSYGVFAIAWGNFFGSIVRLAATLTMLIGGRSIKFRLAKIEWQRAKSILSASLPLGFIGILLFTNSILDKRFASELAPGSITLLNYGILLNITIVNLMSGGLSIVGTHSLSAAKEQEAQTLFWKLLASSFFIMVPIMAAYLLLREQAITLLFGWGKVGLNDIAMLGNVVLWGSGVLVAAPAATITGALYRQRKNREVAASVLVGIVLFWLVANQFVASMGIAGIALAYSVLYFGSTATMSFFLVRSGFLAGGFNHDLTPRLKRFILTLFIGIASSILSLRASEVLFHNISLWIIAGIQIILVGLLLLLTQGFLWRKELSTLLTYKGRGD